ncbi:unnamed protein product [Porites lobata]|uniref:C2H2-type domain-containing protein n=1 Tax=Porites lobata TaxID=104759 RepID=A0ABN8MR15_9CNID|nr:unnamed protein product [Porites lobata]
MSKEDNTDNSQSESSESTENSKKDNTDSSQSESSESTESNDEEDEEKDAKPNKRNKFRCPLRGCGSKVYKLPRHLKNVHGWSAERARNAVNQFDMRHDQRNSKKPKENFVEIEGDSPGEEATEKSNQFKESKKNAAPRGHMNDDTGTLGATSSTSTVDKVIVVESASDGEDDLEYLEECAESDDAVEVQTEACDQQKKEYSKRSGNGSLAPMGAKRCKASCASGATSGDNTVDNRNTNR